METLNVNVEIMMRVYSGIDSISFMYGMAHTTMKSDLSRKVVPP